MELDFYRTYTPIHVPNIPGNSRFGGIIMGKHAIGGMRSMMVPNRKADMRFRKNIYKRNREIAEMDTGMRDVGRVERSKHGIQCLDCI